MEKKEIPVLLLTGYLGSGKTTLVNHILSNGKGIKFAVIVNDIGEVNIDAGLIQKGGVVGKKDESLVALQNGCICCTLKADLVEQIYELMAMERFDYIVIEASGICEPDPIAQTISMIPSLGEAYTKHGTCRLDCIVTVVDAMRMQDEFGCGDALTRKGIDEEDIENLIIRQIEFCNIILLNKASGVKPEELSRIRQIIKTLQPGAEIIECDYADVELDRIINTRMFDFNRVATSAGWVRGIDSRATAQEEIEARNPGMHVEEHHDEEDHHHDEDGHEGHGHHEHGHHHHHGHEGHHHADEVFTSWGRETIHTYTKEQISDILRTLEEDGSYGNVLRAKGMVPGADGEWIYFDMVPEEHEVRAGAPEYTGRICVIGAELAEEKLAELFGLAG